MIRLWRSRKAIFSIIVILLVFLVLGWMGALTFTFIKTEELKIVGCSWVDSNTVNLTVTNTGQVNVTLYGAQVDDETASWYSGATGNLLPIGSSTWVAIDKPGGDFLPGHKYDFAVITVTGNKFVYRAVRP